MGLFGSAADFAAKVLVEYKADTRDATKKVKKLKGEEKRLAQTRIDATDAANKGIDSHIGKLGKATIVIGAVAAAWEGASKAMRAWAEDSRIRHAAAGVSIDALRKASHGLLTEQQLLKIAAAGLNSEFKATQSELERVVGGIAQLSHEGNDLNQLVQVLSKSLAEQGVEELQQFGISVRDVTGAIAVKGTGAARETLLGAMDTLDEKFTSIESDEAVRSLNEVEDATHQLTVIFGEMANTVASAILNINQNLKDLAFQMQDTNWEYVGALIFGPQFTMMGRMEAVKRAQASKRREEEKAMGSWSTLPHTPEEALGALKGTIFPAVGFQEEQMALRSVFPAIDYLESLEPKIKGKKGKGKGVDVLGSLMRGTYEGIGGIPSPDIPVSLAEGSLPTGLGPDWVAKNIGDVDAMMAGLDQTMAKFRAEQKKGFLASIFGPLEEFDAYRTALDSLSVGLDTAFDAWLRGAESIGDAFKKGLQAMAGSLSKELFLQAKKHLGYALGSGALGDWPGAARHAAAAAAFGAGAGLASTVARGGSVSGGGVATAPGAYGGRGAATQGQRPLVVVLAGDYAADRHEAAARAYEAMEGYKRRNGESSLVVDG